MSHPAVELDDLIHQRSRLGIMAVVTGARRVDFRFLKETLELTDGNLSRHLTTLEEAGFVSITKGFEGKRPRTWIQATKLGRGAFSSEVERLRQIVRLGSRPATEPG
jgi:DNA-binding MarR family transcriptional regulator